MFYKKGFKISATNYFFLVISTTIKNKKYDKHNDICKNMDDKKKKNYNFFGAKLIPTKLDENNIIIGIYKDNKQKLVESVGIWKNYNAY